MRETEWVVYAKPPFGGPQQVIEYLGLYTHRVAIGNRRLLGVTDNKVTFAWKDYRHQHKQKSRVMTLDANEFIRRFLMHVLPPGFQRIRHFGFLANCHRQRKLTAILPLLSSSVTELLPQRKQCQHVLEEIRAQLLPALCPACRIGILCPIRILVAYRWPAVPPENSS